jgi:uncharacterized membrane protein YhhN
MTTGALLLLALALVAAVGDWIAVQRGTKAAEYLFKPATLALLIASALALDPADSTVRTWFVVALVFCLIGDVFLMLPSDVFVLGLGAFLLGHLAYIVGMAVEGVSVQRLGIGIVIVSLAIVVIGLYILRAVSNGPEPEMAKPVLAYMLVISAMVATAIGAGRFLAVVGAVLFYASDSLIAWGRFVVRPPDATDTTDVSGGTAYATGARLNRLAVIVTYHLAQVGLVLSLI